MKTNISCKNKFPVKMSRRGNQHGVGLVEVIVAMVLLAIGVLGFSILQVRAIEASGEALNRSQALLILRGLAEQVRANSAGQANYPAAVSGFNSSAVPTAPTSCNNNECTAAQFASWDAYRAALAANKLGMRLNMTTCPGIPAGAPIQRQCLLAGWEKTTPSIGTGTADCISSTGRYNASANCLLMEAY